MLKSRKKQQQPNRPNERLAEIKGNKIEMYLSESLTFKTLFDCIDTHIILYI